MYKHISFLCVFFIILILFQCQSVQKAPTEYQGSSALEINQNLDTQNKLKKAIETKNYDAETIEKILEQVAQTLAKATSDKKVLKVLHEEIGKKFDGQFETLYRHVQNKKVAGNKSLGTSLKEIRNIKKNNTDYISSLSFDELTDYLESVINVQFFMPFYDKWDGTTEPLVAFLPVTKNENEINEIAAFDSKGNITMISEDNAENYCYIIVSPNERTDEQGQLLETVDFNDFNKDIELGEDIENLQLSKSLSGRPDNWQLRFYRLAIFELHEHDWIMGDPEISVKFSSPKVGVVGTYDFDHCFDSGYKLGHWIYFGYTVLFWAEETYGSAIGFLVYERDGGAEWNLSLTYSVKTSANVTVSGSIGFKIKQEDDVLYQGTIGWQDPYPHEYVNTEARLMINSIE